MLDAERIMPLRQTNSFRIPYQFTMEIIRNSISQRSNQQQLPRRRLQQVGTAHDFRDPHSCVVNHHGELISGNIVTSPNQEVAEIVPCNVALPSEIQVCKPNGLAI